MSGIKTEFENIGNEVHAGVSAQVALVSMPEKSIEIGKMAEDIVGKSGGIFAKVRNFMVERMNKNREVAEKHEKEGEKVKKKSPQEKEKNLMNVRRSYENGLTTIKDLVAPSSMKVAYNGINVSGMHAQSFFVLGYPRTLQVGWLADLINSDVQMDISIFTYPIDSVSILNKLRSRTAQIQSSVNINNEKGLVRDPALETALGDVENLRDSLTRGEEKFFQVGIYFTIYHEKEDEIPKIAKQFEAVLGGSLVVAKRADMRAEQAFNSCLPQATDELEVLKNLNTRPLATTFPFVSSELSDDKGIMYGVNRHNETLIIFDRFSLPNANSVTFGISGAGKSYAVKLEILRSLMMGTDVITIDPENEYETLCDMVGGTYLDISLTSNARINPFDLPPALNGEEQNTGEVLRQNIISITGLLRLMLGDFSDEENAIVDKALLDTYALKGITSNTENAEKIIPPTMGDLHEVLKSSEGGESLANRLTKYVTGTYSGIFNKQTNINLEKQMVVFSVRDLDDELKPMAMYMLLDYIWVQVRAKMKKRLFVIDEAWVLMKHDASARFLEGLVRRARKYYLGLAIITQNVDDMLMHESGKVILQNTSLQLLMKQAPSSLKSLQTAFNITEGEATMLLNARRGEGIFFAGLRHAAIQIIASFGEHKIVTTNPEELMAAREEKNEEK